MARSHPRPGDPDGTLEADRHAGPNQLTVQAQLSATGEAQEREAERAGARELDTLVEGMPGRTRAGKDRDRAFPRETTAPLGHPLKARKVPDRSAPRTRFSARQRSERSKVKHQVEDRLSGTQHRELDEMLRTDPSRWAELNDALSEAAGDVQQLPEEQIRSIQRVDRAIQAYEELNDRSHVIYTNVQMPDDVEPRAVSGYLRQHLEPGTSVAFDRFTLGAHTITEIETSREGQGTVVFEIATRRGMYLGQSGSGSSTAHLLPRGLKLWVLSSQVTTYTRADGTTTWRDLVTLTDTPPATTRKEST